MYMKHFFVQTKILLELGGNWIARLGSGQAWCGWGAGEPGKPQQSKETIRLIRIWAHFCGSFWPKVCVGRLKDPGPPKGSEPSSDPRIHRNPYKTNRKPHLPAKRVASNASKPYKTWGKWGILVQKEVQKYFFSFAAGCLPAKRVAPDGSKTYKTWGKWCILAQKGVQKYFLLKWFCFA